MDSSPALILLISSSSSYCIIALSSPLSISSLIADMNFSFSAIYSRVFLMLLRTRRWGWLALNYRNYLRLPCSLVLSLMPREWSTLKKSEAFMISSFWLFVLLCTSCENVTSSKSSATVISASKRCSISITIISIDVWSSLEKSIYLSFFFEVPGSGDESSYF